MSLPVELITLSAPRAPLRMAPVYQHGGFVSLPPSKWSVAGFSGYALDAPIHRIRDLGAEPLGGRAPDA